MVKIYNVDNQAFTNMADAVKFAVKQSLNSKVKPFIGFRGTELGLDDQVFLFTSFEAAGKFLETRRQAGTIFTLDNSEITKWDILGTIWQPYTVALPTGDYDPVLNNPDLFNTSIYSTEQKDAVEDWEPSDCLYRTTACISPLSNPSLWANSGEKRINRMLTNLTECSILVNIYYDTHETEGLNIAKVKFSSDVFETVINQRTAKHYIDFSVLGSLTHRMEGAHIKQFVVYTKLFDRKELVNWIAGKFLTRFTTSR